MSGWRSTTCVNDEEKKRQLDEVFYGGTMDDANVYNLKYGDNCFVVSLNSNWMLAHTDPPVQQFVQVDLYLQLVGMPIVKRKHNQTIGKKSPRLIVHSKIVRGFYNGERGGFRTEEHVLNYQAVIFVDRMAELVKNDHALSNAPNEPNAASFPPHLLKFYSAGLQNIWKRTVQPWFQARWKDHQSKLLTLLPTLPYELLHCILDHCFYNPTICKKQYEHLSMEECLIRYKLHKVQ